MSEASPMRILVTGSARAIGASTAVELAKRGHHVVATARNPRLLDDLPVALRLPLDVTDAESVASALEQAGELDAVVNNSALTTRGPIEHLDPALFRSILETNVIGPLRVVQRLLPSWRERASGVVVNVSSVQGRVGTPLEAGYCASKHALEAISEVLHYEVGHFGIRVVIIEPGYVGPGMKHVGQDTGPDAYDELRRQWSGRDAILNPGGRPGPEIVARAIAEAIEDPNTPLRVEVGADAQMVLGARRQLDDASFEQAMRKTLGLTW